MPPLAYELLGAALLAALLAFIFLRSQLGRHPALDYARKPLLSAWERKALPELLRQLPPSQHMCAQVRLADMVSVRGADEQKRRTALNKVVAKSIDFVVIDRANGDIVLAIELDDRSHEAPHRRQRDAVVNRVMETAGITLVRFKPGQKLDIGSYLARP